MRDVKEKLCYVALGNGTELKSTAACSDKEETYELPDGNIITVGTKRFQPSFIGKEAGGIHGHVVTERHVAYAAPVTTMTAPAMIVTRPVATVLSASALCPLPHGVWSAAHHEAAPFRWPATQTGFFLTKRWRSQRLQKTPADLIILIVQKKKTLNHKSQSEPQVAPKVTLRPNFAEDFAAISADTTELDSSQSASGAKKLMDKFSTSLVET